VCSQSPHGDCDVAAAISIFFNDILAETSYERPCSGTTVKLCYTIVTCTKYPKHQEVMDKFIRKGERSENSKFLQSIGV
jgi:hypothetical protein